LFTAPAVEAGFSFGQALAELEAWSEECAVPRWGRKELIHKVLCAGKRVLGIGTA